MAQTLSADTIFRAKVNRSWTSYLPALLAIGGAFVMLGLRIEVGSGFISDGALMMLALACYIFAGLFYLTNLYAPSDMARKIGLFTAGLGVFFNLSSWLVRWVNAYDRELAMLRDGGSTETPWIFRYVPFANLYDLSLALRLAPGSRLFWLQEERTFRF